jgi:flagellar basal body rod protein FlgB
MSIDFHQALGIHPQALELRAQRTQLLAANIANENTPGYQARDIDFAAALASASSEDGSGLVLDSDGDAHYRVPNQPRPTATPSSWGGAGRILPERGRLPDQPHLPEHEAQGPGQGHRRTVSHAIP